MFCKLFRTTFLRVHQCSRSRFVTVPPKEFRRPIVRQISVLQHICQRDFNSRSSRFKVSALPILYSSFDFPDASSVRQFSSLPSIMPNKTDTTERLKKFRAAMHNLSVVPQEINAYIIPTDDAHQNEYIALADERREYISGFTGSSGTAVITEHKAALWTDGRYFLQAANELDSNWILVKDRLPDTPSIGTWLNDNLPAGSAIGADPTTMSTKTWDDTEKELESVGNHLLPVTRNLVDCIWEGRPAAPDAPIMALDTKYSGKDWRDKVADVRQKMVEKKADYLVVTALDEIAWLLNLRGSDISYNPVFFGYVIVARDRVLLFVNESKLNEAVKSHMDLDNPDSMETDMKIELYPYNDIFHILMDISHRDHSVKVWLAPESSKAIWSCVPSTQVVRANSPILIMKSIKNDVEIQGMIRAHVRDGVALAEFFSWMEKEVPKGHVTELVAAAKLEEIRSSQENYISLSFNTIAGSGPNGAIIHYKPTKETDRNVTTKDMFLLDSGSQYLDGTTDVTRTVHFGSPSEYQKECYTRVLKGNIAFATAKFPEKTTGNRLDTFSRQFLWKAGLDFGHGTGHGVGSFLNVHEGPMSISFRHNPNDPGLVAGNIITDEPGYYEAGAFGIRIEDQMLVEAVTLPHTPANVTFLGLRNFTLVPYDRKLIVRGMLTPEEVEYIDRHHSNCLELVGNELVRLGKSDAYKWLLKETRPLD